MAVFTEPLKARPRDEHKLLAAKGSESTVFLNATNSGVTTGSFQEVVLPAGVECKSIMIQVHNGSGTDFTSFGSAPPVFHFSSTGTDDYAFTQHIGSHIIDVGKVKAASLGYVRAATGQYLVVEVLS